MAVKLSGIIGEFLKAKNANDGTAFAACFADDAVVQDEGREIHGPAAIKKWLEQSTAEYQDTVTPQGLVERGDAAILTALVSGNFDGSPVSLDFHFSFKEGKIAKLSIELTHK